MAMVGVLRLGEIGIRVLDMEQSREHYGTRMGLHEVLEDEQGRVYYKAWDEHDHHSLVLRQSDTAGVDYVAYKVSTADELDIFAHRLHDFGLQVRDISEGVYPKSGRRVAFYLPTGHEMQLYSDKVQTGNFMSTHNPGTLPDEGVVRGFRINRLDHCLLGGPDIDECVRLFIEVFGFTLSEKLVDTESGASLAVFLSCSNKPHDIAFVLQPESGRLHHFSFLLESMMDVIHAADLIGKYRIPVDVGPNRHGVTRGGTIYFYDPSGSRNEVFSGGYVHYPDTPTLTWDTSELGHATFSQDNLVRESFFQVLT
tara:strand:+ start:4999 stop:5931 length:933 start_codon:yes stop_codon:yes gene_type:complete